VWLWERGSLWLVYQMGRESTHPFGGIQELFEHDQTVAQKKAR